MRMMLLGNPLNSSPLIFPFCSGLMIYSTDLDMYYLNPSFLLKMVFRNSVYNRAAELDRASQIPGRAKLAAVLSLILWVGIFSAGREIGFILAPGGLHYAKG
jgi:hypothetical protein